MRAQSRQEFDKAVKDALSKMATLFKTRANKFDGKDYYVITFSYHLYMWTSVMVCLL